MMADISSSHPLRRELTAQGWSLARAESLSISDRLRQDWLSLTIDYADLPHVAGGCFRRAGRYAFMPISETLTCLPPDEQNRFAPLLDTTFDNPFLQELIRFHFRQFPVAADIKRSGWQVDVHLLRVIAHTQSNPPVIQPTDAEFMAVHLTEWVNVTGGAVTIYDHARHPLMRHCPTRVLDFYLLNGNLRHRTAPILPKSPAHPALYSTLILTYRIS